jgi:aminoglycoside 3-N-acetyltransferase I
MQTSIYPLHENDIHKFQELIEIFADVFEMNTFSMPDTNYLKSLLQNTEFIVMIAETDHKVIGGLTAYILPQYYSQAKHVYIHDVGISTSYQRKGIGRQLIKSFNEYSKNLGCEEVFVAAEKEDDHAVSFYRATGGEALESVHFSYTLNGLHL